VKLAEVLSIVVGQETDIEFTAYDGSRHGPKGSDVGIDVRSPRAVSLLMSSPGQLGLARAFVAGELEVRGDLYTALDRLAKLGLKNPGWRDQAKLYRVLAPFALRREPPPPEEVRLGGRTHSKQRDANAIHHHYDVSNRFYRWILGPSMAYTCAVYPKPDANLEEAQEAIEREGLGDVAQVRFQDYRDVTETGFDAISSIGLTEHIGYANYPSYFEFLHSKLTPTGRLLNHCITRTDTRARTQYKNGFINRYIFPDGELVPVGKIVSAVEDTGFEVRHEENLREHYALTLTAWSANLDAHWDEAVEEVGIGKARVWRLYLAASRLGFERNMIQLHQVLAVKPDEHGHADVPLRLSFDR